MRTVLKQGRYNIRSHFWSVMVFLVVGMRMVRNKYFRKCFRAVAGTALGFLFALLVAGAILELGARLRFGRPFPDILPDRETLFRYPENGVAYYWFTEDEHGTKRPMPFYTNALGLRDDPILPKGPEEFRVLMLGDSFTAGMGIEQLDETIPRQLQRLLRARVQGRPVTVINGGLGNSAPYQQLALLRKIAKETALDLVVLQLYPSNDLSDTLSRMDLHLEAYNAKNFIRRVSFARVARAPGGHCYMRAATRSAAWCVLANAIGTDPAEFYARFMSHIPGTGVSPLPPVNPTAHLFWAVEPNLVEWYPLLQLALETMQADVANLKQFCADQHIGLIAYTIPCVYSADPQRWETDLPEEIRRNRVRGKDTAVGDALLERLGIEHPRLYEAMQQRGPCGDLYYWYDMHLNREGARFVAETLADFLTAGLMRELSGTETGPLPPGARSASRK